MRGRLNKKNSQEKYGGCSRKAMPTHLLLLTSEEMDAWWMRGCWPKDKNHRSSKLETGRNVGNAPIKTVFPTWTQYTRARLPLENPKPTSTILYHSQQTVFERQQHFLVPRWSVLFINSANIRYTYRWLLFARVPCFSYTIYAFLCHAKPFHSVLNICWNVSETVPENVA